MFLVFITYMNEDIDLEGVYTLWVHFLNSHFLLLTSFTRIKSDLSPKFYLLVTKDHDYFFSSPIVPSIHHSASHCRLSRNHNNSNNIDYNFNGNNFIEGFYVLGTVS